MCRFGGSSPLPSPPHLGNNSSQRQGMGGSGVSGMVAGVPRVPAGLVGPRIKHGGHGRQRGGGLPRPWHCGGGGFCTRSPSAGVAASALKHCWAPQD